ncbi:hypothetical protein A2335_01410 [Candidatus Peregrinibacteria bacterium RIFOXYB2_FULL_32_7]|nr:MAG: hypothetical protein A2335_01410 [Candidatus Peregrinibacteria bacterium RIFOXYB2_FULL_32_7]
MNCKKFLNKAKNLLFPIFGMSLLLFAFQFIHANTELKPDLTIGSVTPSDTSFYVELCGKNVNVNGGVEFTVTINGVSKTLTQTSSVVAGQCLGAYTWGYSYYGVKAGETYQLTAIIDPNDKIDEEDGTNVNEANNEYTLNVTIPGEKEEEKQADLIISDVSLNSSGYITFTMKNQGEGEVVSGTNGLTTYYIDGISTGAYRWSNLSTKDFFKVNGSTIITTGKTLTAGLHTVKVTIDSDYLVTESNESNNSKEASLGQAVVEEGKPDLTIKNIYLNSKNRVSFTAANIGNADINKSNDVAIRYYVDSTLIGSYRVQYLSDTNFLIAGKETSIETNYTLLEGEHTVKVCVDAEYIINNESNENNNCDEKILGEAVVEEDKPDLIISDVSLNSSGYLTFTMKNQGNAEVVSGTNGLTTYYIDGVSPGSYRWSNLSTKDFFEVNGSTIVTTGKTLTAGLHTVKVTIDSDYLVTESNEANNSKEVSLGQAVVEAGKPDLIISDVSLNSSGYITFTMKNQGNAEVTSGTNGLTTYYIDGALVGSYRWSDLVTKDFFKVNSSTIVTTKKTLTAGLHTVKVTIDDDYLVAESNESNNSKEASLGQAVAEPDLIISDISLNSSGSITFTMKNQGNAEVASGTNGLTTYYIDGVSPGSYGWSDLSTKEFFKVNGSTTVTTGKTLTTGAHTVKTCIDSSKVVTESDENNNCEEETFNIGNVDLSVDSIYLKHGSIVYTTLSNIGSIDMNSSETGKIAVYLNGSPWQNYSFSNLSDKNFFKAGQSTTINLGRLNETGEYAVQVCLTLDNSNIDKSSTNNCKLTSLTSIGSGTITDVDTGIDDNNDENNFDDLEPIEQLPNDDYDDSALNPPDAGYEDEVKTYYQAEENPFSDTNVNTLEGVAAAELYRRAVIGGYSNGEFKGSKDVNRAEAAKFLLLAKEIPVYKVDSSVFWDVIPTQWYGEFVEMAAALGIIEGYTDGSFKPANGVNTAEFLKMLTETFDLETNLPYLYVDVPATSWYAKYAGAAEKYDLFPERTTNLYPSKTLTRNEVAVAIYQYLLNREIESSTEGMM